ncbi:MAG: alanine dehydrogenase [Planctomycetota bacterium]
MRVGVVKEIKAQENRVALTPVGAASLVAAGHSVLVQQGAGVGSGFDDEAYAASGASLVEAESAWATDLVVKVKEPLEQEYPHLQGQILFTYLHLAGVTETLTQALLASETTGIAYETVEGSPHRLPLLAPMSAVAGHMASLMGAFYLAEFNGGKGMLLGEMLGRRFGKAVVIGDGIVGRHAARAAAGLGANVFVFGRHPEREEALRRAISDQITFVKSSPETVQEHLRDADLVVGAVLVPGAKATRVVTESMVQGMEPGSVLVDVSIDQGGCFETSRPTSHGDPVYTVHGVTHYCVTNMPGAYPRTSTLSLTTATLPYILRLANQGMNALRADAGFERGLNTYQGYVTCPPVAEALGLNDRFKTLGDFSE